MNNQVGISVVDAVRSRRSVRGFLDKPVDAELLKELLGVALRSPSGTNIQPWHLHVLTGDSLKTFAKKMTETFLDTSADPEKPETWEYDYYPNNFSEPYLLKGSEPFNDKTAQGPIHISPKASDVVCVNLLDVLS